MPKSKKKYSDEVKGEKRKKTFPSFPFLKKKNLSF